MTLQVTAPQTATVLAQAMIGAGMSNLAAGANPIILRKGMQKATECAVDSIQKMSQKVNGKNHIAKSCSDFCSKR